MNSKRRELLLGNYLEENLSLFVSPAMAIKEITIYLLLIGTVCWTSAYESTEYNRYVTQIFQKYGSGSTISFEVLTSHSYSLVTN